MRFTCLIAISLFLKGPSLIGQNPFVLPIQGVHGVDYRIINYVDWGPNASILDNHCNSKTYNGHQGTDFVLESFKAMDNGVNVLAVDSGVVIFVHDGEFDREKESVISKGLGNYIGITHGGNFQTYYGHLKKNSLLVEVGDTVYAGQVIAQVASSGNSTDPHLHFELWYDSTFYIDPFSGPCGNPTTYWQDQPEFDSNFAIWHSSIWNGYPNLDELREQPDDVDVILTYDSVITYWALLHGIRAGDSLSVEWQTPEQALWFQFDLTYEADQWYHYFWTYISPIQEGPYGWWKAVLFRNGVQVDEEPFYVENPGLGISSIGHFEHRVLHESHRIVVESERINTVTLYDVMGKQHCNVEYSSQEVILHHNLPTGIYHLVIEHTDHSKNHVRVFIP